MVGSALFSYQSGIARPNSPILSIPELQDIKGIDSIQTIMRIRDFVFSVVPWTLRPSVDLKLDVENILGLYKMFVSKESGGWCGLNAEYYQLLLYWFQVKTRPYNFGVKSHDITHVGVIVEHDGEEFFMDPYFAVHYAHRDGFLLTYSHLMALIAERRLDRIVPVFSDVCKPVQQIDGTFILQKPQEIRKSVLDSWPQYEKTMKDIFGQTDPLLLMLIGIPHV